MDRRRLRKSRQRRIRKKIQGTNEKPRLSVFRSNKHIYVQAIDDEKKVTLVDFCDLNLSKKDQSGKKSEVARLVGKNFAKKLKDKKITKVVFDRGGYRYHGRVKSLAEGIRDEGLKF
jgi:large subunit ribosomal protein L18